MSRKEDIPALNWDNEALKRRLRSAVKAMRHASQSPEKRQVVVGALV